MSLHDKGNFSSIFMSVSTRATNSITRYTSRYIENRDSIITAISLKQIWLCVLGGEGSFLCGGVRNVCVAGAQTSKLNCNRTWSHKQMRQSYVFYFACTLSIIVTSLGCKFNLPPAGGRKTDGADSSDPPGRPPDFWPRAACHIIIQHTVDTSDTSDAINGKVQSGDGLQSIRGLSTYYPPTRVPSTRGKYFQLASSKSYTLKYLL